MKKILSLLPFLALTYGCNKNSSTPLSESTSVAVDSIGCQNMNTKVFDSMYSYIEQQNEIPKIEILKPILDQKIQIWAEKQKIKNKTLLREFTKQYEKLFEILLVTLKNEKNINDPSELLRALIDLEMQDQSSDTNIKLNAEVEKQFQIVKSLSQELNVECQNQSSPQSPDPVVILNDTSEKRMLIGLNNVFSTVYQSCKTLELPALDASVPDVSGITRLPQNHPDGIGGRRVVTNLPAVQQTDPYIRFSGNQSSAACFNVRSNPLIYDYGGEPSTLNNILNFFKNAGSGTSALGVDCSAFVASVLAAGGLRYQPGLDNKAIFVRQYSQKFINAKNSNFTCYDNITMTPTSSIKPGDIAAVNGHVLLIDQVGSDPFGLRRLSSINDCSQISVSNFDFVVAQSSNSKGGIGINKYVARDYLNESPKMKSLFISMAQSACRSYFQGVSTRPISSEWGIIRHKGTPECLAPKIKMTGQSCVNQCQM